MKSLFKLGAVLSAVFLLAACDSSQTTTGDKSGGGTGVNGMSGNSTMGELAANVGDRVFFDYDSAVLSQESQETLQRQAGWLKDNKSINVTVEGHCDERGTREYNIALGERRAAAAKKFLVSLGVDAGRVSTISYGKERPAVVGSNESAWSQNRRAVTVITNQ